MNTVSRMQAAGHPAADAGAPATVFRAHCPARHLYVLVRARPNRFFMLTQMEPVAQDQWQLSLPLQPGTYRYRYYADFFGPGARICPAEAEAASPQVRGFDAVLNVPDHHVVM